ncbi:PAS domain S-box protein [Caulobacter sp. BK020]|uniref:PAS domain S-box protein n=1 Tax=Caulobacter sp. BK020 TaxID=2512117 RepID=UPI001043E23D|nr:PAS domain S-box protein [Caulobacter sp. BK020]TCS16770.1 PAS/PAC sensor hybrid histidine kinase [Caulobacter sp. BK020]
MGDRETLRLDALRSFGVLDTQADPAIDRLAGLAANLFDTPIAVVSLVDEQRLWFKARVGVEETETPRDKAFCGYAIDLGPESVMVVEDASTDPRFVDNPLVTGPPDLRFYAGATLTTKDGHNLGTLCVLDHKPRPRPDDAALERLRLLARIVVDEFELAKAHRETREKQRLLEIAETMAGVGHWRLDLSTDAITWSDAVYAIYGVDRETFDPNIDDAVAFYHPDDRERVRRHVISTIETGTGFDFQLRLIRADGALRHVASRGVCEQDDQGRPTAVFGLFQDVTDTVATIETLRRREMHYRLVTEHAGDVITRYDFSGGGSFISPAVERLLGYTVAETVGLTVPSVLHPQDRDAVMTVFDQMSRGLDHKTIQHRSRHRRGHYVWVESNLQLVRDGDGAPQEIVSVSRDISDRKALELELITARDHAREQAQRALLAEDIGGLGYWRYDLRTRHLDVSRKMFEIYGLDYVEQPEIDLFNDCLHPGDRAWTLARIAERLRTGEDDHNVPTRIVRPDGEERCVSGSSITVRGADGLPAFMMGTVCDITEDRRAQAALAENEARYRLLADNASDMIATFNPAGQICFISPACRTVLGREPEELVGRRVVDLTHPDDREHMINYYMALIRRGPSAISEPYEFRAQHKDGRWIWLEGQPKLSFDEAGALVSIQDVAREITARKAMEAALMEARAEAEAAAAVKSEFLSNMSHELRTPLTAVLGFSRLIADQPELSPATRRFVDRVANAGQALMSTINDILDFSKLEAGQVEIRSAVCDPRRVIEDALDLFACQAHEKGITLDIAGADTLPPALFIAPDRVRQVLLNLIGNAVKFTDHGGVMVEVAWRQGPKTLLISVHDTGGGVPADRLDQLFKRFSQIDGSSTRRHGGTGLGLAICKGLVEAMGGQIGVESALGRGSRFWFELPAGEVESAALASATNQAADLPVACRVLVVDDNPVNRDLVRTVLDAFGAETSEAVDGEAAVARAGAEPFDIILMDLRMPGMGGVAAARAIRQSRLNDNVPIIAFSADATEAPAGVFDGVVAKPLETRVLIHEINRALQFETVDHAA